jgi:hypothetical protein
MNDAMNPFKGRLGLMQYMKDKPAKWGIKVFMQRQGISTKSMYRQAKLEMVKKQKLGCTSSTLWM